MAEDLTNDIICEILRSAENLKNDKAFFGYMWRIAENTFKKHISNTNNKSVICENFVGVIWNTPEDDVIRNEQIELLHRELALLAKQYREATVMYYFHGKSCSEISQELGISVEMVKYYLFKSRKILKEGIDMTRTYGEKSYDPATFRLDFWGDFSQGYMELFERRLPGNIMLAAYKKPLSLQELSMELGVSSAYLEDELDILLRMDLIKNTGGRFSTNIVIISGEYEKDIDIKLRNCYDGITAEFAQAFESAFPLLSKTQYHNADFDENELRVVFVNIALKYAMDILLDMFHNRHGVSPALANGGHGYVFSYDNNYLYHHFNGIYGYCTNKAQNAYFSLLNYRAIEQSRYNPKNIHGETDAVCSAILENHADENNDAIPQLIDDGVVSVNLETGRLCANFAVFEEDIFENNIKPLLMPAVNTVVNNSKTTRDLCAELLRRHNPHIPSEQCETISDIRHIFDVIAHTMEGMLEKGQISVPKRKVLVTMYGVRREEQMQQ